MKVVSLLSGGLDSTVLATFLKEVGNEVFTLSIDYGQRHAKELSAAARVASALHLPHARVDLRSIRPLLLGSSQTDTRVAVPEGHYTDESMKLTVVPNRNMILLGVAVAAAIGQGADYVAYAAHAGDHAIYPDCRAEFVEAIGKAVALCDWKPPGLWAPFVMMTKAGIARLGASLGAPMYLTWSCYKGEELHCGKCGTCVERKEAFEDAGVADPTKYE